MATQNDLARHLGVAQQTVSKLKNAGVIPPPADRGGYDLDACRTAYIIHLQTSAAGRDSTQPGTLEAERARLAAAQAEAVERKNAVERRELVSLPDVVFSLSNTMTAIMARLSLVGASVANGDHKLRARIDAAVNDALEELSTMKVVDVSAGKAANDMEDADDAE